MLIIENNKLITKRQEKTTYSGFVLNFHFNLINLIKEDKDKSENRINQRLYTKQQVKIAVYHMWENQKEQ